MRPFLALIRREWLEWRRVVLVTILVITFLQVLALFTVNRGAMHFHRQLSEAGHVSVEDMTIETDEGPDEHYSVDIRLRGDQLDVRWDRLDKGDDSTIERELSELTEKPVLAMAYYMVAGFQASLYFVLFLALFYFSDALFKERADSSTLFYRSLPVSDHLVLLAKIGGGLLGIILLTLFLNLEYLLFTRFAIWILRDPVSGAVADLWGRILFLPALGDWLTYLLASAFRLLPMALFLMIVSAWVKGRPLIVGVGGPILAGVAFAILFRSGQLLRWLFEVFINITVMLKDRWHGEFTESGLDIFNHFWGYIFSWETLFLLLASGGMYALLVWLYRRNLPVG